MTNPQRTHNVWANDTDARKVAEHLELTDADVPAGPDLTLLIVDTDLAHEAKWSPSCAITEGDTFAAFASPYLIHFSRGNLANVALMVQHDDGRFEHIAHLSDDDVLFIVTSHVREGVDTGSRIEKPLVKVLARHANRDVVTRRLLEAAQASTVAYDAAANLRKTKERLLAAEKVVEAGHPLPHDVTTHALAHATDEWYIRMLHSAKRLYPSGTSLSAAVARMAGKDPQFDNAHEAFWARSLMRRELVMSLWSSTVACEAAGEEPLEAVAYCTDPMAYALRSHNRAHRFASDEQMNAYAHHMSDLADHIGAEPEKQDEIAASVLRRLRGGLSDEAVVKDLMRLDPVWKMTMFFVLDEQGQAAAVKALSVIAKR